VTRLQTQYQRLYQLHAIEGSIAESSGLIASHGQVRALVLALGGPADWATLAPVWHGVQADLDWPAPAIAVNGVDAFELWFSLAQPVALKEAEAVLQGLRMRYLADVKLERVRLWPTTNSTHWLMPRIPALLAPERWSAFVAPDLASVFGDDNPSLDVQPSESAQAELLSRLRCIEPSDWQVALALLLPVAPVGSAAAAQKVLVNCAAAPVTHSFEPAAEKYHGNLIGTHNDPGRFLLDVMNNPAVPLALRVDAAKALLSNAKKPVL
jgi:hypothetical protein